MWCTSYLIGSIMKCGVCRMNQCQCQCRYTSYCLLSTLGPLWNVIVIGWVSVIVSVLSTPYSLPWDREHFHRIVDWLRLTAGHLPHTRVCGIDCASKTRDQACLCDKEGRGWWEGVLRGGVMKGCVMRSDKKTILFHSMLSYTLPTLFTSKKPGHD